MTAAEFVFLAAGLLLGAAGGAAIAASAVRRPATPREVRVTIVPGAIPRRRAATLATDPFVLASMLPAPGGPADPWVVGLLPSPHAAAPPPMDVRGDSDGQEAGRTLVPNGLPGWVAVPIVSEVDPMYAALLPVAVGVGAAAAPDEARVEALVAGTEPRAAGTGPDLAGSDGSVAEQVTTGGRAQSAAGAVDRDTFEARLPGRAAADALGRGLARVRLGDRGSGRGGAGTAAIPRGKGPRGGPGTGPQSKPPNGPCAELGMESDRECGLAHEAHERLDALAAELVAARQQRDRHMIAVNDATLAANGLAFREARELARAAFQLAREQAVSARDIAAAAATWLQEVDRINAAAATADGRLERERASLEAGSATVEHLTGQVDAARRAADAADAACSQARQRAADCADAAAPVVAAPRRPAASRAAAPAASPGGASPRQPSNDPLDDELLAGGSAHDGGQAAAPRSLRPVHLRRRSDDGPGPRPAIERMLAGEHDVLRAAAAELGRDEADREAWESRLTALLEAVLLKAIDAAAIDVPPDHPFWSLFTLEESRDIVSALAALGHHFDGLGGWLDERSPDQRHLSIAVAHAGLDPMRIRQWPSGHESAELLRDAVILGGEYLLAVAPGLSLEDLQSVLGREGEALADLWAEWDRVQPILLGTS